MGQSVGSEVSLAWDNTGELLAQPDSPESAVDIEEDYAKLDLEPNSDIQEYYFIITYHVSINISFVPALHLRH